MTSSLSNDPLLRDIPEVEGFKVLDRRFVLYELLGQGGMGIVYRGRHLHLNVDVAVKCLDPMLARREGQYVERFLKEARAAAQIDNENIVRVYDVSEQSGVHYIAMQFIAGENARERVQRKGRLSVEEAAAIALGAARGLAAAHRTGLVHRDVKPENLLISVAGEVKVADLGLAKVEGDSGMTFSGATMGTPRYMPPEQFGDAKNVDARADVYALGATLYFLLVGRDGIRGDTFAQVLDRVRSEPFPSARSERPEVPEELDALIARCTHKDAAQRPSDGGALVAELERLAFGNPASLGDDKAGATLALETLISPPPQKTLGKIRMSIGDGRASTLTPVLEEGARGGGAKRGLWIGLAAAVAALLLLMLWRPWESDSKPDPGSPLAGGASPAGPAEQIRALDPSGVGLVLTSPLFTAGEHYTSGSTISLVGRIEHPRSGVISIEENGRITDYALDPDGAFNIERGLSQGALHTLQLSSDGIADAVTLRVIQDSEPPKLTVQSPSGAERTTPNRTVKIEVGVVESNPKELRVGGRMMTRLSDRLWSLPDVDLPAEGANLLRVVGEDLAGNVSELELEVVRDTLEPSLRVQEPRADARIVARDHFDLVVAVEDHQPVSVLLGALQLEARGRGAYGRKSVALPKEGINRFELIAADREGLEVRTEFEVVRDTTPPRIEVLEPGEGARTTAQGTMPLRVAVHDANPDSLTASGRALLRAADGTWSLANFELPKVGANRIPLVASDRAGNVTREELVVTVDTSAPSMLGVMPAPGSEFRAGDSVEFLVTLSEPAARVTLAGIPLSIEGNVARGSVQAPDEGRQWAPALEISDRFGNRTASELSYRLLRKVLLSDALAPAGFEVLRVDPDSSGGQPAGAARQAGWAWEVRDPRSGITFLLVEAGKFQMGAAARERGRGRDELPQRTVEITRAFYMAKTEVTQAQWRKIRGTTPSRHDNDLLPVGKVSWDDATTFCEGLGYRLPSEAEWEYVCRAGTSTTWSTGATLDKSYAYFDHDEKAGPNEAGALSPNPWGFFDLHGNVWEWCQDVYDPKFYARGGSKDPVNLSPDSAGRVIRGGSYQNSSQSARSAYRSNFYAARAEDHHGFRPVVEIPKG